MPENTLKNIVKKQKAGQPVGICSACSSNPFVIEAVLEKAATTTKSASLNPLPTR